MRRSNSFALLLLLASCAPKMGNPASLITDERIIGVRGDPAEAAPGDLVQYSSLVASPSGSVDAQDLSWSLCNLRKPVAENTPISQACLTDDLPQSAQGGSAALHTPGAACANFGPLAPPSSSGTLRPADPDATGGYYQPIRLDLGAEQAIFRERLGCGLAGASLAMSQQFRARYTTNQNPTLVSLQALVGDTPGSLDSLPAGQRIRLLATWSSDSAESYPVFDSASQTLADHREALWVSWFITSGAFDDSVTGREENDPAVSTENSWQSPTTAGVVFLWLILHDSRGGADFGSYTLTVLQ
jgi:hypothetical protein